MKISIKELVESIIDLADNNLDHIVRTSYVISADDIDIKKAKDYPALFMLLDTTATVSENSNIIALSFYFIDAVVSQNDSYLKDLEIKSDLMQEASKLFDLMQTNGIRFDALDISLSPFSGRFNDGMGGWSTTVNFNIAKPCFTV